MAEVRRDAVARPADLDDACLLVAVDGRRRVLAEQVRREGQGTFRARLLEAYEGQCAITGEHTEPVLDAAHIQPYLGPASNHVQNGLLLTQELHTLFDRGLVCVEDILYVDAKTKPLWTHHWTKSTKVSQTGRVMPATSALTLHAGAGTPLIFRRWLGFSG